MRRFFKFFNSFALHLISNIFVPESSATRASTEWMNYRADLVHTCKSEDEADRVVDLLRSMLVLLDPAGWPSIRQMMETHPWLQSTGNNVV